MRLFTGISIAPAVAEALARLLDPLKQKARLQWSPPENLHITTKFLGEWPAEKLKAVLEALERMPRIAAFTLDIERLGFFPNAYSPRVLWAGVRAPQNLAELARETDQALGAVGVESEKRSYSPHVTLARIKPDSPLVAIRKVLEANAAASFGASSVADFHLYQSNPAPGGSRYQKLATFALL